jgi:uncharacterized protein YcbX
MIPIPVGRVSAIYRYPVKSMAAQPLPDVEVFWRGLVGDRRWAFIREGMQRNGFPWLTIRQKPDLWHYRPYFIDPGRPDASQTVVVTPSGVELEVADPKLAEELGDGVTVMKQNRGIFDTMPLSLMTTQTVRSLGTIVGADLDPLRFRPNLVIDTGTDEQFPEDRWVGSVLRINKMRMRVDIRDSRCVLITVDPVTTQRNPAVLAAIARHRGNCLGVYGSPVQPGHIAVGDEVVMEGNPA